MDDTTQLFASINHLKNKRDLTQQEIASCVQELVKESTSLELKKRFLLLLSQKGESDDEFAHFVNEFRKLSIDPNLGDFADRAIDLCGTGGDKANSFNISTFVSFMLASAGIPVIKHGNRSISSKCGSADLIEAIGIPLSCTEENRLEGMKKLNFSFLFAPQFHPAFKHIGPVRKSLAEEGIITIFNLLGPAINPAKPSNQLLGVFSPKYMQKISHALTSNDVTSGLVVHGFLPNGPVSGVDELTSCGENKICGIGKNKANLMEIWEPSRWKQKEGSFNDLAGGTLDQNIKIMKTLIEGNAPPALLSTVIINAATAFWIVGRCSSLGEGAELAESILTDGLIKKWLSEVDVFFK